MSRRESQSRFLRKTSQDTIRSAMSKRISAKKSEEVGLKKRSSTLLAPRTSRISSKISLPKRSRVDIGDKKARPGAIEALITAIRCFPENEGLLRECCETLATYSPSRLAEWETVRSDAVDVLVTALGTFLSKAETQLIILDALIHLVTMEEENPTAICNLLVTKKTVQACLAAMEKFPEKVDIQVAALKLIGFAALSDEVGKEIVDTGALDSTLKVMKTFSTNEDVLCNGCLVLGNLAVVDEIAELAEKKGATALVLTAMKKNDKNVDLQDSACRALGSFAMHHEICLRLVGEGSLDLVITLMKANLDNEKIQECGCWAMACFSTQPETVDAILKKGGLPLVVNCMDTSYSNRSVQEYGCRNIVNFCTPDDFDKSIASEEVVNVLLSAMDTYESSLDIAEQAMFALSKTLQEKENLQKLFLDSNGIDLMKNAMQSFKDNEMLLESCMLVVGSLSTSETSRKSIVEADMARAWLACIKSKVGHENMMIQCIGCNTVANLVSDDAEFKKLAFEEGIVDAVMAAMKRFDDAELQESACSAMACLIFGDEGQLSSVRKELATMVLSAMKANSGNEELQMVALQVLHGFGASDDEDEGFRKETAQVVVGILTQQKKNTDLHLVALEVLYGIAANPSTHSWMLEEGVVSAVVNSMKTFQDTADIQESGAHLLSLLCFTSGLCSKLVDAGVVDILQTAMEVCSSSLQLLITCCGAFTCFLSECSSKVIPVLAKGRCVQLVIAAMKQFSGEVDLVLASLLTVKGLMVDGTVKSTLKQENALETVKSVLSKFAGNEEVQTEGSVVVRELSKD